MATMVRACCGLIFFDAGSIGVWAQRGGIPGLFISEKRWLVLLAWLGSILRWNSKGRRKWKIPRVGRHLLPVAYSLLHPLYIQ